MADAALINRDVVLLQNRRMRPRVPGAFAARLSLDGSIEPPDEAKGDKRVRVGGVDYWVIGRDLDEARRPARTRPV